MFGNIISSEANLNFFNNNNKNKINYKESKISLFKNKFKIQII
jgi:hypothetical protein